MSSSGKPNTTNAGGKGTTTTKESKRKKSKRPPPPTVPPPIQFKEEDADMNSLGEREEAVNPFTSVERVVSIPKKKKETKESSVSFVNDPQKQKRRGGGEEEIDSFQKRNEDLGAENNVNDGYLFVRYVSMKPKITLLKSLGFLCLELGLAIAFICGYTLMGKGVHVYDFLNKPAHYDAAWYIGVSCFGVFFLLWLLDADVILRHERKRKIQVTETHDSESSDDEDGDARVGTHVAGDAKKNKGKNKSNDDKKQKKSNSSGGILPAARELSENDLLEASEDAKTDYKMKAMALNLVILICGVGLFCAALLASGRYVTAPVVIYVLVKIGLTAVYKKSICRGISTRSFMVAASRCSFFAGSLIIGAWFFWVFAMENNWDKTKYTFPNRVFECDTSAADGTDSGCVSVYMMWMLPGATGFLEFLFGATANFLSRPGGAVRMIAVLMMIFGLGTYIQVSISGVEMGIADDIIQFVVLFVGMFLMLLFAAAGRKKISKIIKATGVETKVAAATNHPIMKGFLLCAIGPLLPAGILISAVSSACRRIGLTFRPKILNQKIPESEKDGLITHECRAVLRWLFDSPTTTIVYATWIALSYFIISIGVGKGAVIFLAWLVSYLKAQEVWLVFLVFFGIGVFMFLLPPIPGPPVYLTGGIVIVGALEDSMGFWPGVMICGAMCWFVKLFSCMLQQKAIGEPLGNRVSVRAMCAVNTPQMRAIKVILLQKGLPLDKLAVLCGGPDWPTSVLCGIIRVPLHEAMLGTAPVIVLYLMYVVVSGAIQLKIGGCEAETTVSTVVTEEDTTQNYWQLLNAVMLALSAVSMGVTMFGFAYFMDKALISRKDEIDAVPIDVEVEEYEKSQEEMKAAYKKVSEWEELPKGQRVLLCIACVFSVGSAQVATVLATECFKEFGVACKVAVMDVVTLYGWIVLGAHAVGLILMIAYGKIQKRAAARYLERGMSIESA
jgi:hypothetical protein